MKDTPTIAAKEFDKLAIARHLSNTTTMSLAAAQHYISKAKDAELARLDKAAHIQLQAVAKADEARKKRREKAKK